MTLDHLILAMLAEAVFLLLLWLVYSVYKIKKLKKNSGGKVVVKEVTKEVTKEVKPDVETPTYLTFLHQAMLATELRLEEEQQTKEEGDSAEEDNFDLGGGYSNPLELRMAFIRSEISAIEASGEDGGTYWSSQEQSLKEILENIPTVVAEPQPDQEPKIEKETQSSDELEITEDVQAIQTELNELKLQAQALEQYKSLFYGLAGKLKDVSEAAKPIPEELETVKSQLEDATAVELLAAAYDEEYTNLKDILENIGEGELDEITLEKLRKILDMRTQRPKEKVVYVDKAEHKVRHQVDKIKQASSQQQGIITELQGMLEMSEDEGMKGEFLARVNSLEAALSESKMCIDVLESENQSRQEQLEDLLFTLDDLTAKAERLDEIESGEASKQSEQIGGAEIDPDDLLAQVQQESSTDEEPSADKEPSTDEEPSADKEPLVDKESDAQEVDPDDLLAQVQQEAAVGKEPDSDYDEKKVELEREKLELKRKLDAVQEEKQDLNLKLQEQQDRIEELETKISKFSRETGDVMNAVVTLEDENDRLMDEVDQIRHEKEELEEKIRHEHEEEAKSEIESDGLQDVDPDDIDALLAGASDILNEVNQTGAAEEQAGGMGEEEFKQVSEYINKEIDNEVEELERQNKGLNEELQHSKELLDAKQEELENALEEFNKKEQEYEELTKKLGEKDEYLKLKQATLDKALAEIETIKEELEEKDTLYERLKKEYAEMEKALSEQM